ncbi:hypothetical protein NOL32_24475, partial [Vibrio parahaemolyticus]|nr:hypothetical protein [Vibrio parahaemolyticus]
EPSAVKVARWVLRETALGNKCRPPDRSALPLRYINAPLSHNHQYHHISFIWVYFERFDALICLIKLIMGQNRLREEGKLRQMAPKSFVLYCHSSNLYCSSFKLCCPPTNDALAIANAALQIGIKYSKPK